MQRPPTNQHAARDQKRSNTIRGLLESRAAEMSAILPKHMSPEKLLKVAMFAVLRDPKLQNCTDRSLVECVLKASILGLEPNTPLGHAYLVPFKTECTLVIGYRGFVQLAIQSGHVQAVWARAAHEGDQLNISLGTGGERIEHRPELDEERRGPLAAVYAIARYTQGGFEQFEWMSLKAVQQIRARSRAAEDGPWVTDFAEMAKKTVVRRLCKNLPLSSDVRERIEEIEEAETVTSTAVQVPAGPSLAPVRNLLELPVASEPEPAAVDAKPEHPADLLAIEADNAPDLATLDALLERARKLEDGRTDVLAAINARRNKLNA